MAHRKKSPSTDPTAIAQRPTTAIADPTAMFLRDAGAGMEGATSDSFAIPFLMILQKGSPQVDPESGTALKGAKAGMLFENINGSMVDGKEGLTIIPCAYRRVFLHFSESKGFQGELLPEEVANKRAAGEIVEHKNRLYIPEKDGSVDPEESDRINDARNHYVLIVDKNGMWRQALISLQSTQIKKSRALMTALNSLTIDTPKGPIMPPTFASKVKVTTVPESNDKGSWMGWHFELNGFVDDANLYEAARRFHKSVTQGTVAVKYTSVDPLKEEEKEF